MERSLGRNKKKRPGVNSKEVKGTGKYSYPEKKNSSGRNRDKSASDRFRKITERAKEIRKKHPKMKWKNCVKQASEELY